jgi:hypothetical protein
MRWTYHGLIMSHGNIMGISQVYYEYIAHYIHGNKGIIMGISWNYHGHILGI